MRPSLPGRGFTLVELVLVVLLLAIVASATVSYFRGSSDAERWEETRRKMEAIRAAVLGDPSAPESEERSRFGYFGDMGRLPGNLTVLTSPEAPAWAYHTYYGIGAGWRGPYVSPGLSGADGVEEDAWGRPLVYATTAVSSLGSDGVAGGTNHATDITVDFPPSRRLSTIRGRITEGGTGLANEVVEVRYPVNGALVAATSLTASDGSFLFPGIPFGQRSLIVTSLSPVLGPVTFAVDRPELTLSPSQLDYFGRSEVLLNTGTLTGGGQPILIYSARGASLNNQTTSVALAYTVPSGIGSNLVLVAMSGGEDNSNDAQPVSAIFGTNAMYMVTGGLSGSSGTRIGVAMFSLGVAGGQAGTITVNYLGNVQPVVLTAYVLSNVGSPFPDVVSMAVSDCCNVTADITPQSTGAMIVSGGHIGNRQAMTPVGTGHVEDIEFLESGGGGATGALGHVLATSLAPMTGIGWNSASPQRAGVILASFLPIPEAVGTTIRSTYRTARTLDYITVRWSGPGLLKQVGLAGITQDVPSVPSGTRVDIHRPLQVPAGSASTDLSLLFDTPMVAQDFIITFEWSSGDTDTISFTSL